MILDWKNRRSNRPEQETNLEPEQDFGLHRFDQIAKPNASDRLSTAVDLGGHGSLILQQRKFGLVNSDSHQNAVSFFPTNFCRALEFDHRTGESLAWMAAEYEGYFEWWSTRSVGRLMLGVVDVQQSSFGDE